MLLLVHCQPHKPKKQRKQSQFKICIKFFLLIVLAFYNSFVQENKKGISDAEKTLLLSQQNIILFVSVPIKMKLTSVDDFSR
jgi:hypothetical protein